LGPCFALLAVFWAYPLVASAYLATHATAGPHVGRSVGLDHFAFLFGDPEFATAVWNTIRFTACALSVQIPLALGLALLLEQVPGLFRRGALLALVLPYSVGGAFAPLLFRLAFLPRLGVINQALEALLGIPADTSWLTTPGWVLPALVLVSTWLSTGINVILISAALRSVDPRLREAALVDGAGTVRCFWHITLPHLRPTLGLVTALGTIGSFKTFELPWLLLNNGTGPDQEGLFLVTYLYRNGFILGDLGYASAVGWFLAAFVALLAAGQLWLGGPGHLGGGR
jgi:ABC-type sugar transport system permease subunit